MRVTYDEDIDAAYIHFDDQAIVARTDAREIPGVGFVNLDLDEGGHVVGIEVIGARDLLPASVLAHAEETAEEPRAQIAQQ